MTLSNLEKEKIIEEIHALKKPWYARLDGWVAFVAIISSVAGISFQYSLHDKNLLIAKAEQQLAIDERVKAENEKYFIVRENIALSKKLEKFENELKSLIEDHNRLISAKLSDAKEVQALVSANYQFLDSISKKQKELLASARSEPETTIRYYSWIDQLLSGIISAALFLAVFFTMYEFIRRKHPEVLELARLRLRDKKAK